MTDFDHLLASWNDGPTRRAIVDFVAAATNESSADYVPPAERIATFDNDGTLWVEKPMPIQLDFTLTRLAEQAGPTTRRSRPPAVEGVLEQRQRLARPGHGKHYHGDDSDLRLLMAAVPTAFAGLTVEEYGARWPSSSGPPTHPSSGGRTVVRVPAMVELLRYLEANGFATYIASGGDRDFMRPFAGELYGIPPERVIGSSLGPRLPARTTHAAALQVEDGVLRRRPEKPVRIWSRIGRRPLVAGGNSNGDVPMLRFARPRGRPALRLLLRHDDAEREFDYTAGAEEALARAAEAG